MAHKKWSEIRSAAPRDAETEALVAARKTELLEEIALHELRGRAGLTQSDLAGVLAVSQAAVSKTEHADDIKVSTLRAYLAGLGAELRLMAVFHDDTAMPIAIGGDTDQLV